MTTLCIDTVTDHGMVVVAYGEEVRAAVRWHAEGKHAENIFGFIERALSEAGTSRDDLSLIGVDIGPGRFTSVRIGLATAKGLALGLGIPIVGVDALRVLARSIEMPPPGVRVPIMNAYRGDVVCGAYRSSARGLEPLHEPLFGKPREALVRIRESIGDRDVAVAGDGVEPHADLVESTFGIVLDSRDLRSDAAEPQALADEIRAVHALHGPADLVRLEAQYLRPSDAKRPPKTSSPA